MEDESYITELKENIKNKYQCVEDKGLKWDLMKMEVRGFTIAFAKRKAKNKRDEEKKTTSPIKRTIVSVRKVQKQSTTAYTYTNYSNAIKTNNRTKSKGCNHTMQSEMG